MFKRASEIHRILNKIVEFRSSAISTICKQESTVVRRYSACYTMNINYFLYIQSWQKIIEPIYYL